MNLYSEIVNIQINEESLYYNYGGDGLYAYKQGHKDASNAASELSLKSEAYIERLEYYIRKMAGDDILQEIKEEISV